MDRLETIKASVAAIENIAVVNEFAKNGEEIVSGKIGIREENVYLEFEVDIFPQYPFQYHGIETIRFLNPSLIEYGHVNSDGSICIHTPHNSDLSKKIFFDIESLKKWVKKYYIDKEKDNHYDHIIVSETNELSNRKFFLFTAVENESKFENGFFRYSHLSLGKHDDKEVDTFIVQSFKHENCHVSCDWSTLYKRLSYREGLYTLLAQPPVQHKRFVVKNWKDLEPFVCQNFLKLLDNVKKHTDFKKKGITELPILFGYPIPSGEIHWQCAIIDILDFPHYSEKIDGGKYIGRLNDIPIKWVQTKNCSYDYFFGRGALDKQFTEKKILLIGIGAIGSIVATTLVRGGVKNLALVDFDIKEPENVCRSEYNFNSGLNSKVLDLKRDLVAISPFVEVATLPRFMDAVKAYINDKRYDNEIRSVLQEYDLIIDCTADNDVAYILDMLSISSINVSITNNAKELVCIIGNNIYSRLMKVFEQLENGDSDYYHPAGCWNPTFKASYNDVNVLVQYAIKQVNYRLSQHKEVRDFYVAAECSENFEIKLKIL